MFKTFMGPVEDSTSAVYLRPETAQGIFVNFRNVLDSSRQKVPFGIAQVGKAFRNEITPGNFTFRTREFEQMEMQFFVEPGTDEEWYHTWKERRLDWVKSLGIQGEDRLRLEPHGPDELAHYAKDAVDIEYLFPMGWREFEGIHNRTDFDLSRHQEHSGKKLEYVESHSGKRFIPVCDRDVSRSRSHGPRRSWPTPTTKKRSKGESRTVLRLHPRLAPTKAAVFPLVKKEGMPEMAARIAADLRGRFTTFHDVSRVDRSPVPPRQDEAGTPFCITVDGQSIEDGTVTVRDRDTLEQVRVAADGLTDYLHERIEGKSRS